MPPGIDSRSQALKWKVATHPAALPQDVAVISAELVKFQI